jgi:hypothetical protein
MMVRNHLTQSLGMKCDQMRGIPHMSTAAEKAKRPEMAESMLQTLESHATSNVHFPWTGDESWIFYGYHYETTWEVS